MSNARLPAFSSVLKSREVEDPINLWVHRPLAYGIVALIYRTSITPNQITLVSGLLGVAATLCWLEGSPSLMVAGGALLWWSAIVDGADGILARAKKLSSDVGRALDGATDASIGIISVGAAYYHLWLQHHDPVQLALMPIALATTIAHVYQYDFYKEAYLQMTNPSWNGHPERLAEIKARAVRLKEEGAPWHVVFACNRYVEVANLEHTLVGFTNPQALRDHLVYTPGQQVADIYRRHQRRPIKLWSGISVAPHMYMISLCGMFDRLDIYLWYRAVGANLIYLVALMWQRHADRRTLEELASQGLGPKRQPA